MINKLPKIFTRFTQNAYNALLKAYYLAYDSKHSSVDPEHLLYTLLQEKGSLASEILKQKKLSKKALQDIINKKQTKAKISNPNISKDIINILQKSALISFSFNHQYIGTEHLLAALLENKKEYLQKLLKNNFNLNSLYNIVNSILQNTSKFPALTETFNSLETNSSEMIKENNSVLEEYAVNLTNNSFQQKIDPLIAREKEINEIIEILMRRTKNNPLLIGEPGVGKTAIVEGLAKKIINADIASILLNKKIYSLDLSSVIAGTMYRGDFENRIKQIINQVSSHNDIILFIDEIHNICGAGSVSGTMDAANILKPALSRGNIRCIGATTFDEYRKHIEKDPALNRRFQTVFINEPNKKETIKIIQGIKKNLEKYHHVNINNQAIKTSAQLAEKYLPDKFFPDKAIDIIDQAAAKTKINNKQNNLYKKLFEYESLLKLKSNQKEKNILQENFKQAIDIRKQEYQIAEIVNNLKSNIKKLAPPLLDEETIYKVISNISHIPVKNLKKSVKEHLKKLDKSLNKYIMGQNQAIEEISNVIKRNKAGLNKKNKPMGTFLFIGPPGVGKTYTAKILAQSIFGREESLIRIDMSEYSDKFTVSKLIGSPAGYVGYQEGGILTNKLKKHPYSVVLFDEIEKAHYSLYDLLLQILDEGYITDGSGKKLFFNNTIIILTSNIGSQSFDNNQIGFYTDKNIKNAIINTLKSKLKEHFNADFLDRIEKIVSFTSLNKNHLKKICKLYFKNLTNILKEQNIKLTISDNVANYIMKKTVNNTGARNIQYLIKNEIENYLAENIINDKIKKGSYVNLNIKNNTLNLSEIKQKAKKQNIKKTKHKKNKT
jgi:ATP-dependent Clp protease ATP-binding subunit ClpC